MSHEARNSTSVVTQEPMMCVPLVAALLIVCVNATPARNYLEVCFHHTTPIHSAQNQKERYDMHKGGNEIKTHIYGYNLTKISQMLQPNKLRFSEHNVAYTDASFIDSSVDYNRISHTGLGDYDYDRTHRVLCLLVYYLDDIELLEKETSRRLLIPILLFC